MKKVIKFQFDGKEGFLSIVEKPSFYYTLVKKDTDKVASIRETHQLMISYELKPLQFVPVAVSVVEDPAVIQEVYHQLEQDKNLYFKVLDDSLIALKIAKEN